jgi:alpha-aminoadipate carrier protein LysW
VEKVTNMTDCNDCGAEISLKAPVVGEIVDCPDCGLELEVRGLDPLRLDAAPEVAEDWGE